MRAQLRQLSGDTAIYGVTTIVQRFLAFLLAPFYTHFLMPNEFGVQAVIFVLIAFIMIFANLGMEPAFFKFTSTAEDDATKRGVFWNAVAASWFSAALIGGAIFFFPAVTNTVALLRLPATYFPLISMAGLIIFFDAAGMVALAHLRMARKAKLFGAIKIGAILINVGLNVYFVVGRGMKLEGILLANVIQSAAQFLFLVPIFLKMLPLRFDRNMLGGMFRFGLPTIASGISAIALQRIDQPILQNLRGYYELGLYQNGYRLGIIMMMFVSMFEFAWRPFFLQQASKPNARPLFARVFTYFNLAAGFIFLFFSLYIVNIAAMHLPFRAGTTLIDKRYWVGLVIVPMVLAAYIFNGWYTNFIAGVYIEKKTSALPWVTGIGAITEAALCFALFPTIGISGGAWATLAAYMVMALSLLFYIRKYYEVPYEWGRIAKIAAGAIGLYLANILLLDFFDTSLRAILIRLALLVAYPVWLFATGFFEPRELLELRRIRGILKRERPA